MSMEGTFEVDRSRVDEFYHQYLIGMLKIVGIGIQVPLTILIIAYHDDSRELLSILFILVLLAILCFASVKALRNSARFEGTIIIIDKDGITRKGEKLLTVSMDFKNISKIRERQDGLVLCRNTMPLLFGGRYVLSQEPGILFIPSMIKDYERIHNFFVLEKYKNDKERFVKILKKNTMTKLEPNWKFKTLENLGE